MAQQAAVIDIAKQAAKEAVQEYVSNNKKKNKNTIKKRTKKLMSSYNSIKAHVEEGVSEVLETDISFARDDIDENDLYIMSIRRSRIRSMIMVAHIEKCLALLKDEEEKRGTPEKYEVFIGRYMEGKSYEELAATYSCATKTAMRWVTELDGVISLYLYGVDGLVLE